LAAFLVSWVFFGGVYTLKSQVIIGLIVSLLVAIAFRPFYNWLRNITDTFLFKGEYQPQELIADISDFLSHTLEIDKIIRFLEKQIGQALRVEKIEVVILEDEFFQQAPPRQAQGIRRLREVKKKRGIKEKKKALSKLTEYFKKQREALVLEEFKRKKTEGLAVDGGLALIKELTSAKTALAVPLYLKEKLVGLFLLGEKKSGDMFTNEDIKTLETIAAQSAIALENARSYEKMKDFSKMLQREVERQTKELRKANIELQKLDKAKSEFISIASHQLRTPVSVIKGITSMMLEGDLEKFPPEKKKQFVESLWQKSCKLESIINDILNATEMTSAKYRVKKQRAEFIDLEKLLEEVISYFQPAAQERKIDLSFIPPKKSIPKIYGEEEYLREVFNNLIDNALKYTPSLVANREVRGKREEKGIIFVSVTKKKNNVIISIKDNGIGIPQKEIPNLFKKFTRASNARDMYTDGSGLGLFIAKEIVEGHGGKIWLESQLNKGTTFFVSLPIHPLKKVDVKEYIMKQADRADRIEDKKED
jgi:signal transduction histidine kinase